MYLKLRGDCYKEFIGSHKAWFYLSDTGDQTRIQYISCSKNRSSCAAFTPLETKKGVMVWAAICCAGKSKLWFIEPGCKINAEYYSQKVLKPFIKEDYHRLYPSGDDVFQQDSASAYAAKLTVAFLKEAGIPFITPEEWMLNSPDCAPCDFFLWGYLKKKLFGCKATTIDELKNVIRREYWKILQFTIDKPMWR